MFVPVEDTRQNELDLAETVATRHFATHNKRNDQEEPRFDGERVHLHPEVEEALAVYSASGFTGDAYGPWPWGRSWSSPGRAGTPAPSPPTTSSRTSSPRPSARASC